MVLVDSGPRPHHTPPTTWGMRMASQHAQGRIWGKINRDCTTVVRYNLPTINHRNIEENWRLLTRNIEKLECGCVPSCMLSAEQPLLLLGRGIKTTCDTSILFLSVINRIHWRLNRIGGSKSAGTARDPLGRQSGSTSSSKDAKQFGLYKYGFRKTPLQPCIQHGIGRLMLGTFSPFAGKGRPVGKCARIHTTDVSYRQESADWRKLAYTSICAQKTIEYCQTCGSIPAFDVVYR